MPPAARMADPTTHGAPLAPGPGSANVMIGFMPAWRAMIDQHACPMVSITGPDGVGSVMMGSPTVFINFMMACRMGDIVIEKPGLAMGPANPIIMGCPTVMIGEVGMPAVISPDAGGGMGGASASVGGEAGSAAQALTKASDSGAATVVVGGNSSLAQAAGAGSGSGSGSGAAGSGAAAGSSSDTKKTWVEIQLLDPDGKPVPNEPYKITAPDGTASEGCTDSNGVARVDGIDPGTCKITFTALDQQAWTKK
jgi:hypothetical protein